MAQNHEMLFLKTNRIEALSDGIFAIAMTILILSFDFVMDRSLVKDTEAFYRHIRDAGPDLLHYVESFFILGCFWFQHHNQLHFVKYSDPNLVFINIFFLMFISLIPITTVLVSDLAGVRFVAILFGLNLLLASLVLAAHWLYATHRHQLMGPEIPQRTIDFYRRESFIAPVVCFLGMSVSLFYPRVGVLMYFVIPFILIFYRPKVQHAV